jgi:hypothetical protein
MNKKTRVLVIVAFAASLFVIVFGTIYRSTADFLNIILFFAYVSALYFGWLSLPRNWQNNIQKLIDSY